MKLLIGVALLVTIIVACEGKMHDRENKFEGRPSIHMQVKKHHHNLHMKNRMRGKHMDLTEVHIFSKVQNYGSEVFPSRFP